MYSTQKIEMQTIIKKPHEMVREAFFDVLNSIMALSEIQHVDSSAFLPRYHLRR